MNSTADEFVDANPRACAMLGYSHRELLSLSARRILPWKESEFDWLRKKGKKSLRRIAYRQKTGHLIPCDISAWPVQVSHKPCILVRLHGARHRELAESMRKGTAFMRFANAVVIGVAQAPTIEHGIRFCIHHICDFARWPLGHAHILAERILSAHVPTDIWYFGLHGQSKSRKTVMVSKPIASSDDWYSRIVTTGRPFIADELKTEANFTGQQMVHDLDINSALVGPILVGSEVVGILEFFSHEPMEADNLLLELMTSLGARVGHIIEHKRAENNVQSLSTRLFHLQDDERRHLAKELHDTTGQNVAAIIMDLAVIGRKIETLDSEARTALSECVSLARQSLHEIRTFSYLLHPPMLDELGLVSALRVYIEGFSQRSRMRVDLEVPDSYTKLPNDLEVTLFHVVQEGLTNAHRHAGSSWAKVRMSVSATEVRTSVENEAAADSLLTKGFVPPASMGVGIRSMRERVQHFGGQLALHSDHHRTVLEAILPLSRAAKATSA
jgi:PAS domain S-box-containing protein